MACHKPVSVPHLLSREQFAAHSWNWRPWRMNGTPAGSPTAWRGAGKTWTCTCPDSLSRCGYLHLVCLAKGKRQDGWVKSLAGTEALLWQTDKAVQVSQNHSWSASTQSLSLAASWVCGGGLGAHVSKFSVSTVCCISRECASVPCYNTVLSLFKCDQSGRWPESQANKDRERRAKPMAIGAQSDDHSSPAMALRLAKHVCSAPNC